MLVTSCVIQSGRIVCVLARESIRTWSIAFGLSALIHVSLAGVLSGQSWMMWEPRPPQLISHLVDLVAAPAPPIAREEPRPVPPPPPPPPPRATPREIPLPRPAPRPIETKPVVEPPPPEVVKRIEAAPDSPPVPPPALAETRPVLPTPPVETPPANPAPPRPPSILSVERQRDTNPGTGLVLPEGGKSAVGEKTVPASSGASTAVASVPRSDGGSSAGAPSSGTSSGGSTRGITQWAHPQGGYQVRPSYPASARRLGIQGTARLRIHVLADGRVGEIIVESSAGHADLDQAATDAVRQWRFEPARKGTEPVATWVLLPVQFQLK